MNKKIQQAIEDGWLNKTPVSLGDKNFYTFHEDGFKQTQERFEAFADVLAVHEEFKTTSDDVDSFMAGVRESIKLASLDIKTNPSDAYESLERAKGLLNNFDARRKLGNPLEKSLELASFLYIGEDENPFAYDHIANKAKIDEWKKKADTVLPLVLEMVLPDFLTWSGFFQLSFLSSMRGNMTESMSLMMQMSMVSSLNGADEETLGIFTSRTETLASFDSYYTGVLKNITDLRLNSSPNSSEGQNKHKENRVKDADGNKTSKARVKGDK